MADRGPADIGVVHRPAVGKPAGWAGPAAMAAAAGQWQPSRQTASHSVGASRLRHWDALCSIYSLVLDPRGRPTAQLQPKEFQNALKFGKLSEQQEYRTRPRM